jgi:hypothetical protein
MTIGCLALARFAAADAAGAPPAPTERIAGMGLAGGDFFNEVRVNAAWPRRKIGGEMPAWRRGSSDRLRKRIGLS